MEWPNGLLTSNIFDDIQIEITDLRDSGLSFLYFNPLFEKTALIFWTLTANQHDIAFDGDAVILAEIEDWLFQSSIFLFYSSCPNLALETQTNKALARCFRIWNSVAWLSRTIPHRGPFQYRFFSENP